MLAGWTDADFEEPQTTVPSAASAPYSDCQNAIQGLKEETSLYSKNCLAGPNQVSQDQILTGDYFGVYYGNMKTAGRCSIQVCSADFLNGDPSSEPSLTYGHAADIAYDIAGVSRSISFSSGWPGEVFSIGQSFSKDGNVWIRVVKCYLGSRYL